MYLRDSSIESNQTEKAVRRIISVSRLDEQLSKLVRWVCDKRGRAIIRIAGKRAAVLISYQEYEEMQKLRTQTTEVELLEKLKTLRRTSRRR